MKPVLVAGMATLTAGLVYFTQVSPDGSYLGDLLPGFLLIGVGIAAYAPTALTGVNDWADTEPVSDGIRRAGLTTRCLGIPGQQSRGGRGLKRVYPLPCSAHGRILCFDMLNIALIAWRAGVAFMAPLLATRFSWSFR